MIKHYCDFCGKQVSGEKFKAGGHETRVPMVLHDKPNGAREVGVTILLNANCSDICLDCAETAIHKALKQEGWK